MENIKLFTWQNEVRDYELDLQGVVNNANYLHYFEHARHLHLEALGLSVKDLHDQGYDLVLLKTEIEYKQALRSGDRFKVESSLSKTSRLRYQFNHTLYKQSDSSAVATSSNIATCICNQTLKPCLPSFLKDKLELGVA